MGFPSSFTTLSSNSALTAHFRVAADSLFTAFFPDSCRLCDEQLVRVGRAPVCDACFASLEGWQEALLCSGCEQTVQDASALDSAGRCGVCRRRPPAFSQVRSAGPYDGSLRRLIHLLKYDGMRPLADVLAARIAAGLGDSRDSSDSGEADLIVPAPLHWRRRFERGFNQSSLIANGLAKRLGVRLETRALVRVRPTSSQAGLSQHERKRNLRGAFRAPRAELIQDKTVLLIDDVMTTGATLNACAKALRRAGAKEVRALVAARAQLGGRVH